jgi:hypothetical protein
METPVTTKRLHISGLTPSLTAADLEKRLSSFSTVKVLDGFGLVDAVGQPRKFGYATIEATESGLAKCQWTWWGLSSVSALHTSLSPC